MPSSGGSYTATTWGTTGDVPEVGDYDGDGDTDAAVFRPADGTWSVKEGPSVHWGTGSDIALPLPYGVRKAFLG